MRKIVLSFVLCWVGITGWAQTDHDGGSERDLVQIAVETHILPAFADLAGASTILRRVAQQDCTAQSPALRRAYHDSFDAWVRTSHLRFGPTEQNDRAFALGFWPDTKGFTPKMLKRLIAADDMQALTPQNYAQVSIAARGFYALEFLLYDPAISTMGRDAYRCALVQIIATDISTNANAILADWQNGYAQALQNPTPSGAYRTRSEAVQELYKAVLTGLQFTADTRLGRPLGSFDRPRPKRAEARRSGRSARHVALSLGATRELALILSRDDPGLADELRQRVAQLLLQLNALQDPEFAGVATPQGRFKTELLQQNIRLLHELIATRLGALLGVQAGFNALDGD